MSFLALCAFVNKQGLVQTLLVRLPLAYVMSIQPHASLTKIGLAAPVATSFGIVLNVIFYLIFTRKMEQERKIRSCCRIIITGGRILKTIFFRYFL